MMTPIPFFVGCYTRIEGHVPNGCGEGIYSCLLCAETGRLTCTQVTPGLVNPSYIHVYGSKLFAVEEMDNAPGDLVMFDISGTGELTARARAATAGSATCHVTVSDNLIFAASYCSGSASAFVTDGQNLSSASVAAYTGRGPNAARQEAPHAHQVAVSPDGRWLYVCDLGSDRIWLHPTASPLQPASVACAVPGGYGPRHLCFHPNLPMAYIICELTGMLLVCGYHAATGTLAIIEERNTLPADYTGGPHSAAIRIHPTGQALYVSNRGHNSVAIFAIDAAGCASAPTWLACGGKTPRDINIDPSGRWLLVANQDSDTITVFAVDAPATVNPASMQTFACRTPTAIAFGGG